MMRRVRFDRREFGGAFGDLGTDLPLLTGMILASGADIASVLIVFGLMQVFSGLVYGIPMPMQPLKAVAVIVIAGGVDSDIIYGAGIAIGLSMLLLTLTGAVEWLTRTIPTCVIRGIQFGLGLKLALLSVGSYIPAENVRGALLAVAALAIYFFLRNQHRVPAALVVLPLGVVYALAFNLDPTDLASSWGLALPQPHLPTPNAVMSGFLLLALAQLPLSLGNSVLATNDLARDLFPQQRVTVRKIGFTYSLVNIVGPLFSGFPACHGCGGLAGHHAFGARTGGSAVIYGTFYLVFGLFLSNGFQTLVNAFPLPLLGAMLLIESITLLRRALGLAGLNRVVAYAVGLVAAFLPYGFLIGMVGGTLVALTLARASTGGKR